MNPDLLQSLFDSSIKTYAWMNTATQLWQSAAVLLQKSADAQPSVIKLRQRSGHLSLDEAKNFEQFELHKVGLFLVALAIENFLKGMWAAQNESLITNIKHMRNDLREITEHDLVELARAANVTLSVDEEELLNDLTETIVWYGRYPSPLRIEDYKKTIETGTPLRRFYKGDVFSIQLPLPPEINQFVERLMQKWRLLNV